MTLEGQSNQRWYILALVVLTSMTVSAIPSMGMSVLAKEISQDLHLNLVQIGVVWGIGSLPGIVTGLFAGAIGDKIGPKRIMIVGSLLGGLVGAARGLATNFTSMIVIVILVGALLPFVSLNGQKTARLWFAPRQLGLANGLISMGMASGFLIGSLVSATFLSPWLGGWRNVLILYGLIGAFLSPFWFFTPSAPRHHPPVANGQQISIRKAWIHMAGLKNIWLLGLMFFGVGGCIQGVLGYLPIYLRSLGWEPLRADGALSAFHMSSLIFVLPIAFWSDRLGKRKHLLILAILMVITGTGLLSFVRGAVIWLAVLMAGMVRDAFMAIFMTMVVEAKGVGRTYAGTAYGFVMALGGVGNFLAPPLGNSLAKVDPGMPFVFWALLAFIGLGVLLFTREG